MPRPLANPRQRAAPSPLHLVGCERLFFKGFNLLPTIPSWVFLVVFIVHYIHQNPNLIIKAPLLRFVGPLAEHAKHCVTLGVRCFHARPN